LRIVFTSVGVGLAVVFGALVASAQPKTQQAVAATQPPAEFVSKEGGFRIKFPGTPKPSTSQQKLETGPAPYHQFLLTKSGVVYLVSYIDHSTVSGSAQDIKAFYELARAQESAGGQKLVSEKTVSVDGVAGREFVTEDQDARLTTRQFLVGKRLYKLIAGIKRTDQAASADAIAAFMDSFHLLERPADRTAYAKDPDPEEPLGGGLLGSVEGGLYRNDVLSVSMKLPDGWLVIDEKQYGFANNRGSRTATRSGVDDAVDRSMKNTATLVAVSKYSLGTPRNASLVMGLERLRDPAMPAQAIAAGSLAALKAELPLRVTREVYTTRLGGAEFASFSVAVDLPDGVFRQNYFVTNRRGQALTITNSYVYDDDAQAMERSILSLRFALH
jgi:hypothetical protein